MYSTFGIGETINKPQLTVNDLGLSYRTINYWDNNNLLLGTRKNDKGWRKFSFIDFIWINIVQSLREFGFSADAIHKIKALCIQPVPEEVLKTVNRKERLLQPKGRKPSFLTNVAAELITSRSHLSLLYNKEGHLYVLYLNAPLNNSLHTAQLNPYLNYICLSLSEIYLRFLQTIDISIIEKLKIFPESLIKVTGELRNNIIKSIVFNYKLEQVVISQEHYIYEHEFARDCLRLLTTTVFNDYEIIYYNGSSYTYADDIAFANTLQPA